MNFAWLSIPCFAAVSIASNAPAAAPASTTTVGHVTIQVRNEPGYSANEVATLLHNPSYLGSVAPGLRPMDESGGAAKDGVYLSADAPTGEIVTLSASGADENRVQAALNALLANLKSIQPGQRLQMKQELDAAERRFADANQAFEAADRRRTGLLKDPNGGDVSVLRGQVESWLASSQQEQQQSLLNLAKLQAIHDYLVAAIAKEPKTAAPASDDRESEELTTLAQRVQQSEADLAELTKRMKPDSPEVKNASAALDDMRMMLAKKRDVANAQRQQGRRADMERELFKNDRDLELLTSRMKSLESTIEQSRKQLRDLTLANTNWDETDQEQRRARELLDKARLDLENARARAQRYMVGAWLDVIAGPTFENVRDV